MREDVGRRGHPAGKHTRSKRSSHSGARERDPYARPLRRETTVAHKPPISKFTIPQLTVTPPNHPAQTKAKRASAEANATPRPYRPRVNHVKKPSDPFRSKDEPPVLLLDKPLPKTPEGSIVSVDNGRPLEKRSSNKSIAQQLSPIREFLFVTIICLAQFMTQAGLGQCLSILQIIGEDFGVTDPGRLAWLIAGYSLTVGTFILIAGRLGDVFGYKRMLIVGFAWFSLWSVIEGLASYSNHVLFIFARVFAGIGPAIILTNGLAILGASYTAGRKKDMVFALFGATAPGGSIVGAVFAAIFAGPAGNWAFTFYSFAIVLVILTVTSIFVIPDPPRKTQHYQKSRRPFHSLAEELDATGGLIGVTALVLINFAWNQAGVVTWKSAYVCVSLVVGLLMVPVFFWYELRKAKSPLVPFEILRVEIGFVLACVSCGWGSFGIWVYYTWQFLLQIRDQTPLVSAAQLSPVALSGALAAILTGYLLSRIRAAIVMTMALTAFLIGNILIATAPPEQVYWAHVFVCTLIIPFGMDMSFPAATVIVSNALPSAQQGIGASLVNTVVNYSISLALGFAGTVEMNVKKGDELRGLRSALYVGIGLASFGLCVSLVFLARSLLLDWGNEEEEELNSQAAIRHDGRYRDEEKARRSSRPRRLTIQGRQP